MRGIKMQDRVTAQSGELFDIVIQYGTDLDMVGVGLEPREGPDSHHFVDSIYGSVPNQTKIGKIFEKRMNELGWDMPVFHDADSETEWFNKVGRAVLDSVIGSTPAEGLWTWLSRPASNRAIRLVRKARDVSFGRDE